MTSLSSGGIESQFEQVGVLLGGERGAGGHLRGYVRTAPFLLKITSADPPGYLAKFRMTTAFPLQPRWNEKLAVDYLAAGVRAEIDPEYLFLEIEDPHTLTAEAIVGLIVSCVEDHSRNFPKAENYCFACRRGGVASLIQNSSAITALCDECLEKRQRELESQVQRLNPTDGASAGAIPLMLLLGGLGWAGFWVLFDLLFRVSGARYILLPSIVIYGVLIAAGILIGGPTGWLLHRSGAGKRFPLGSLVLLSTLLIVLLGEFLYSTYYVYRILGVFDISTIVRAFIPLAVGEDYGFVLHKLAVAAVVAACIGFFARPREVKLRL